MTTAKKNLIKTKTVAASHQVCPIEKVATLIGDSWSPLIVRDLLSGPKRFGDFSTSLAGISTRTLTLKLQFLEEHGIVERKEYSEKPPRVEYKLTKKGHEFNNIIDAMRSYGKKWLK